MRRINLASNQFSQRGVAAVEFALIAIILFTLIFGITEFGRILFMMNTTAEATRLGARLAVVCDKDDSVITSKMVSLASFLTPSVIEINYIDKDGGTSCDVNTCRYVTVRVKKDSLEVRSLVPLIPINNFYMPEFSTTLPRESMSSSSNPICN